MKRRDLKKEIENRAYEKFMSREHWGITIGNKIMDYQEAEKEVLEKHKLKFNERFIKT